MLLIGFHSTHKPQAVPPIDVLFRAEVESQQQPPKAAMLPVVAVKGTRSDSRFLATHPEIVKYQEYLMTVEENQNERQIQYLLMSVSF